MPSVIFMGRKPGAVVALEHLMRRGWEIWCVITPSAEPDWVSRPTLAEVARQLGLVVLTQTEIIERLAAGWVHTPRGWQPLAGSSRPEWLLSYLFPYKVKPPLLTLPALGALNFHPAPLPEYGGLGGYNFAILEDRPEYGVTCHYMDEGFDTGDVVEVRRFAIDPSQETALSLERCSQKKLLELFVDITMQIERGIGLPRISQQGQTRYITREEFEQAKRVELTEDPKAIARKVRAFWYPPYDGAKLEMGGTQFTLVVPECLASIASAVHSSVLEDLRLHCSALAERRS